MKDAQWAHKKDQKICKIQILWKRFIYEFTGQLKGVVWDDLELQVKSDDESIEIIIFWIYGLLKLYLLN